MKIIGIIFNTIQTKMRMFIRLFECNRKIHDMFG